MHITIASLFTALVAVPFAVVHMNNRSRDMPQGMTAGIEEVSSPPKGMKPWFAPRATTSREGVFRTTSNEGMLTSR